EESGPGHSGGFGEDRFLGMSELTESPESGSEGSGRRFEHAAEILLGERLGVPEPRMAVDESVMQHRRRLPEIGCDIESRLLEIHQSLPRGNSRSPRTRSEPSPPVGTRPPRNARSSPYARPPSHRTCGAPPRARTRSDRVGPTRWRAGGGWAVRPCPHPSLGG